jgi:protein-S-isoprenylcysteine O-methyltransferase Ste14
MEDHEMTSGRVPTTTRWTALAAVSVFFVSVAEMVFMVSPFAAYFYGFFSPLLGMVQSSPQLVWLSAFWISHIAFPNAFLDAVTIAGGILGFIGLTLFIVHAAYLYTKKFRKKGIANRLLYAYVRHPQYTALMIGGLGLAISWPRFLNLVLFCVMVAAYYALARFEESRMEARFGDEYRAYAGSKAMFFPGAPGGWVVRHLFGRTPPSVGVALAMVLMSIVLLTLALGARVWSIRSLQVRPLEGHPATLVIDFSNEETPLDEGALASLPPSAHAGEGMRLLYVLDGKDRLEHLLLDSGILRAVLRQLDIPEAELYVVAARGRYPERARRSMTRPSEALGLRALRELDAVYVRSEAGEAWTALEFPVDAFPRHSSVPALCRIVPREADIEQDLEIDVSPGACPRPASCPG